MSQRAALGSNFATAPNKSSESSALLDIEIFKMVAHERALRRSDDARLVLLDCQASSLGLNKESMTSYQSCVTNRSLSGSTHCPAQVSSRPEERTGPVVVPSCPDSTVLSIASFVASTSVDTTKGDRVKGNNSDNV